MKSCSATWITSQSRATASAKAAADEAAAKAQAEAQKVKEAAEKAGAVVEAKAKAVVPSNGNKRQWANWTADQLRRLPDVKTYGALKLHELTEKGPAAARGVWATAKDAMKDYENLTVDDLIAQFGAGQH